MRIAIYIMLFSTCALGAAPARPAVKGASVEELHAAAVVLMRAGEFPKAAPLLEQAYRAKPAADHSRPLLLNHAMLDVKQRVNVMRAIKDLRNYMQLNPVPDEQATNILGAALVVAGKNERVV